MSSPLRFSGVLLLLCATAGSVSGQAAPDERAVAEVLDALHEAAANAEFERYFGLYAEGAIFLGTDATERWTLDEFRAYARPSFDAGRGWTYVPTERHIYIGPDARTAWFDERLDNATFGETRGTGVLVKEADGWKVAQYNLTVPIPNSLLREFVARIRAGAGGG